MFSSSGKQIKKADLFDMNPEIFLTFTPLSSPTLSPNLFLWVQLFELNLSAPPSNMLYYPKVRVQIICVIIYVLDLI
jgi:hypothetical protein